MLFILYPITKAKIVCINKKILCSVSSVTNFVKFATAMVKTINIILDLINSRIYNSVLSSVLYTSSPSLSFSAFPKKAS